MRNLPLIWDAAGIEQMVKKIVSPRKVLRVHKFKDYSFIHFHNRADAEIALSLLRGKNKIVSYALFLKFVTLINIQKSCFFLVAILTL